MTYVPFPGGAPAVNALLGDHVTAVYGNYSEVFEQIKGGRLRALAATGTRRIGMLPDLPTIAETLPGYEASVWYGISAPKGTPPEIIARLNSITHEAMADPSVQQKLADQGLTMVPDTPDEFRAYIASETQKWAKVIKDAGVPITK